VTEAGKLGRRVAVASLYAILQRVVLRCLGFVSTLILVRLLSPEDFGIVALASAVYVILDMLTATGFGLALLRMQEPTRAHYDTIFTLGLVRAAILVLALVGFSGVQAELMGDPRIQQVIWVIALALLIGCFESPRLIDFQRNLRFDRLLHYAVLNKVLGLVISLPLAFWLQNYWALVLAGPLSRLVTVPYSYRLAPYQPRLSLAAWRELINFSKWLLLHNLCCLIDGQLMNWIIGRTRGIAAVGLYQVGYQIAALPVTEIAVPIRSPFFAGFARIYHDLAELRRQFLNGLELQWLVLLPLSVGVALTAREVTLIFLGERWVELVPLIPLIALYALCDSFGVNTHNIFLVLNRQAKMVITYFGIILVRTAAVTYGAYEYGIIGAVWALLITAVVNVTLWQLQAGTMLRLAVWDVARVLWRGGLAALLMCGVVWLVPDTIGARLGLHFWPVILALVAKAGLGACTYVGTVLLLWLAAGAPGQSAEAQIMRAVVAGLARMGIAPLRRSAA